MTNVKRNYKSSLFADLFGREEHREHLLSLCNALNGTDYPADTKVQINTIEGVVYVGIKNDVSCIIDNYMNLIEHQSTVNPNMPLRGLMYYAKLYDKYIAENDCNIYSSRIVPVPTPRYFVLFNGNANQPDCSKQKLSDAFVHKDSGGEYEWTTTVLNINYGHNGPLLRACSMLREYALLVAKIKDNLAKGMKINTAVSEAIDACIKEGVLADYLRKNKAEVNEMLLNCSFEEAMDLCKRDYERQLDEQIQKTTEAEAIAAEANTRADKAEAIAAEAKATTANALKELAEMAKKMAEMQKKIDELSKSK